MSINDYGIGTHTCGQDVVEGRRVKLNSGDQIVYATATALGHGVTRNDQSVGEDVGVAYYNKPGTHHMEVSEGVAVGQNVYAAASGKVQGLPVVAGDYIMVGVALEAAADDGDFIEVLPVECGKVVTVS
ncbi:MAG: DUF2190 family protein [Pseudodesulfovibrio sp.]|nr:DUF2190 family protein [Pseudodesulfovibrio sp.]